MTPDVVESGDRLEDGIKIEITPEMVEAGALVVASFFDEVVAYGSEIARLTAIEAYSAMERARGYNSLKRP